ncbi:MAG: glycosyltransferase [Actinomycetota bacterium]
MRLAVFSHKVCWVDAASPAGHATDGGFAKQMDAIAELFDETVVHVPVIADPPAGAASAQSPFLHDRLRIEPLPHLEGSGLRRRLRLPWWLIRSTGRLVSGVRRADAVHTPIPGDIGTIGIVLAEAWRRPLLVRYCGNWLVERTRAERLWHWYMRRRAGGRRVMLATGGAADPPAPDTPALTWIFSASLRSDELPAAGPDLKQSPSHGLRLITVGRQEPYKGTGAIIDAMPQIRREHPGATLDVIGDGTALDDFRMRAEAAGVGEAVAFHGLVHHDEVIAMLLRAHVFVFPTKSEGFPKVVAEALACGTPVVASPVSVIPSIIDDSVGALLADDGPEAIARAVGQVADEGWPARSEAAVGLGRTFTLDGWRDAIAARIQPAWGRLRSD